MATRPVPSSTAAGIARVQYSSATPPRLSPSTKTLLGRQPPRTLAGEPDLGVPRGDTSLSLFLFAQPLVRLVLREPRSFVRFEVFDHRGEAGRARERPPRDVAVAAATS